jgi:hypothetical protein
MKERRAYTKEFKAGTAALAEKREKPVMAYRFMHANQGRYSIREMTGLFGVTRPNWRDRGRGAYKRGTGALVKPVCGERRFFRLAHERCGRPCDSRRIVS